MECKNTPKNLHNHFVGWCWCFIFLLTFFYVFLISYHKFLLVKLRRDGLDKEKPIFSLLGEVFPGYRGDPADHAAFNLDAAGWAVGGWGWGGHCGHLSPWGPAGTLRALPGAGEEPRILKQGLFSVFSAF